MKQLRCKKRVKIVSCACSTLLGDRHKIVYLKGRLILSGGSFHRTFLLQATCLSASHTNTNRNTGRSPMFNLYKVPRLCKSKCFSIETTRAGHKTPRWTNGYRNSTYFEINWSIELSIDELENKRIGRSPVDFY